MESFRVFLQNISICPIPFSGKQLNLDQGWWKFLSAWHLRRRSRRADARPFSRFVSVTTMNVELEKSGCCWWCLSKNAEQQLGTAPRPTRGVKKTKTSRTNSPEKGCETIRRSIMSWASFILFDRCFDRNFFISRSFFAVSRTSLCRPCTLNIGEPFCKWTSHLYNYTYGKIDWVSELFLEFLQGRLHKWRIPLHSYLRKLQRVIFLSEPNWRRGASGEHQRMRVSA